MLRIHNFARGARGQRVMWLCEEMGLPYCVENHTFPVSAAYRALNPLGTVPFLEDTGGVAFNESIAMLIYIVQRYGPTPLWPTSDPRLMARCLQVTVFGETELGMNLNALLAAHFMAPPTAKGNWSVVQLDQRVRRALDYAADLVAPARYAVGETLTLADISLSCALNMWQGGLGGELPQDLAAYQETMRQRPAYQRAGARCAEDTSAR